MKKLCLYVCLCAFGVAVALSQLTPAVASDDSVAAVSQSSAMQPGEDMAKAKTFTGRISQVDGKYVLEDGQTTFQLDDQERAKEFNGKSVKVTGKLDVASNTIHVTDIQVAA